MAGKYVKVPTKIEHEIIGNFEYLLSLKKSGLNLFFVDIDKIKEMMEKETFATV